MDLAEAIGIKQFWQVLAKQLGQVVTGVEIWVNCVNKFGLLKLLPEVSRIDDSYFEIGYIFFLACGVARCWLAKESLKPGIDIYLRNP
ncbi:MAG: hypothetical protein O2972_03215 [Cyanobacteria bacterium]|nr:hypothetical protein [Cyanobacteriota bacterium]